MANGIRISKLRRDIARHGSLHSTGGLVAAHRRSALRALPLPEALDGEWLALPQSVWSDVIRHLGVHKFAYGNDIKILSGGSEALPGVRRDCDGYAACEKGRSEIELTANGVGMVVDYSGRHAYCCALTVLPDGALALIAFEPQANAPDCWEAHGRVGRPGPYRAAAGLVRF